MKHFVLALMLLSLPAFSHAQETATTPQTEQIQQLFTQCLEKAESYSLLEELCLGIGHRLSGSPQAAAAVKWGEKTLRNYGFDSVWLQPVTVPHWERGKAEIGRIEGQKEPLSLLALGGSGATPAKGIKAEVVVVRSLEEVDMLGESLRGKVVFYTRPLNQRKITPDYGGTVDQRSQGPARAARYGAVAVVIRSVSTGFDDVPHTGVTIFSGGQAPIPAAALGMQSADRLEAALQRDPHTRLFLNIQSRTLPDAASFNVVGELRGSEKPDEIILVSGHLDSWDVGHGAHDDGAGCVHAIGALRALQQTGYRPKHTLRVVLFMNEENGLAGGNTYAKMVQEKGEKHLVALESDIGGYTPRGFGLRGPEPMLEQWRQWLSYFDPMTLVFIRNGGGGADINPLNRLMEVPVAGLSTDYQKYFDLHHTAEDTFDKVNRRELELGTAAMAAWLYLLDFQGFD